MRFPPAQIGVGCAVVLLACAMVAQASGQAVDRLVADLRGNDPAARRKALEALVEMGPAAAPAVPALINVLQDADEINRDYAVTTLSKIGAAAEPAIPALRRMAQGDLSEDLRQLAKNAIGEISAAVPAGEAPPPPAAPDAPPMAPAAHDRLSKDAYVGVYRGEKLSVTLESPEPGQYSGVILLDGQKYPFQGEFIADLVIGTFQSEGNPFGCTFTLNKDGTLKFETGTSEYALRREQPKLAPVQGGGANPLDRPAATAAPANPFEKPARKPQAGAAPVSTPAAAPVGFRVAAETSTGRALIARLPNTRSAKAAVLAAERAVTPTFDAKPQLLAAVGDQNDRRAVATFAASVKGAPVEGTIVAGVGDAGNASVSVIYDRKGATNRERSLLAAGLPAPMPEIRWESATLSDGSATVRIPSDWRLVSGQRAMCTLQGAEGQEINLGIAISAVTPDLGEYRRRMAEQMGIPPQDQIIGNPNDPVQAYVDIVSQMSRIAAKHGMPPTRVVTVVGSRAIANRNNWPSAFVDCVMELEVAGAVQRHRAIAMVICSPAAGGQWMLHLSQMRAPVAVFDRDLPTMIEIWGGWGVSPEETKRRLDEAAASMRATTEILRRAREERAAHEAARKHAQQEQDRPDPNADFDETIRGWRTVEDTLTGERKQVPLGDVDDIVQTLNEREGWGRYKGIPLRNEW